MRLFRFNRLICLIWGYAFLILSFTYTASARQPEARIRGKVLDARTKEPLQAVGVFLNNTFIGTSTDALGNYELRTIPPGTYTLVFSHLGHARKAYQVEVPLTQNIINTELAPVAINLGEISVSRKKNTRWMENLEFFKSHFLGSSRNSYLTDMKNPEVLNFTHNKLRFQGWSTQPLILRNNALGYTIQYHLESFIIQDNIMITNGYARFHYQNSGDPEQRERWESERRRAYHGSYRHFLNALVDKTLRKDGFRLYFSEQKYINNPESGFPAKTVEIENPDEIFRYTRDIDRIELINPSAYPYIRVDYLPENPETELLFANGSLQGEHQVSWLEIPGDKVIVEFRSGHELSSYRSLLHGYWAWSSRIPELLPREYDSFKRGQLTQSSDN